MKTADDAPICVTQLTAGHGGGPVVRDVSFTVDAHRVMGLLGPPGAGKTTILRVLLGLTEPKVGTATFAGRNYRDLPDPERRVGAVLEASDGGALDAAIARLPAALVLDEPTFGLDEPRLRRLGATLQDFARGGNAVLLTAPEMTDVAKIVDDVVILRDGKVIIQSTISDLRRSAARQAAVRVHTREAGRMSSVLNALGRGCLHLARDVLRVHDVSEHELWQIADQAQIPITQITREEPDLQILYAGLTS
jgi:ABC-2 type transport system ATP-binding protein